MNDRNHDHKHQQQQDQQPASASSKACEGQEQERPLNSYEAKQEARRERLLERAGKARGNFQALHNNAHEMADVIPFGQPILVGHHSENKDRRYRERIHNTFGKAFKELDKAKHLESRAAAVGTGGVSSDDPDAIEKLRSRLAKIEADQAHMKAVNAAIRKGKTEEAKLANLAAMDIPEAAARKLLTPDFAGRVGYPSYSLTNNNANRKRIELRIKQLEQAQAAESVEIQGNGYEYRECTDENRVMFTFPGKPDAEVRDVLKSNAFKWSPSRGAWVRQLTESGKWAGGRVRKALDELTG